MFDDLRERATADFEDLEPEPTNPLAEILDSFNPKQRFVLSLMLLLNVVVIGCMCLIAFGRIQF
jgi:hypothetical protein